MIWLMLLLQSTAPPADIELRAEVSARSVTIEKQGEARLAVRASPDGGNIVDVDAPKANGRKTLRNVRVRVDARARLGTPQEHGPAADNKGE